MATRRKPAPPAERSKLRNVALFKDDDEPTVPNKLSIEKIILPTSQPRRYFDSNAMQSLVESVKKDGILQPLLVRPLGENYELVAGERRLRAATSVGLTEVPVVIREMSDEQALQYTLVENLQREDLNPVEETEGILQLLAINLQCSVADVKSLLYKMQNETKGKKVTYNVIGSPESFTVQEVFASLGKMTWDSFAINRLTLLNLPEQILEALRQGRIEYTKAKEIAKLEPELRRTELLSEALAQNLSLSQIRERIKALQPPTRQEEFPSRMEIAYKKTKKAKLWENPKKRKKLESLLKQLEALVADID